ncbi:MAG: zinc ribbon domain-containing protein [Deltaproteobacteria bacterium]|nr:zinc ribbon domain-containing protein [Deltaproteobacteria bacterium]
MPIYEFYCADCHTVFNFLSRSVNTEKRPGCPRCGRPALDRQVSLFAISKGRKEADDGDLPDLDDEKMERAMEALAGEMEGIDEEDPRQMAGVLRKLYGATGLNLGPGMEEAIRRMEAGEDPDAIEQEMGDLLEGEDPLSPAGTNLKGLRRRLLPPSHDDTLYEL